MRKKYQTLKRKEKKAKCSSCLVLGVPKCYIFKLYVS